MHTRETRSLRTTLLALAALALALADATAASANGKTGPGPFDGLRIADDEIVVRLAASSVPFSGDVAVSAAGADAAWVRFDRKPSVEDGGKKLVLRGTIGGAPVDAFFADGDQRRLLFRNGDGRTTEIDVLRYAESLLVTGENRRPGAPVKATSGVTQTEFSALENGEVTVTLPAREEVGYDVAVAVTFPDPPRYATGQRASIRATDAGGTTRVAILDNVERVGFVHFTLPEGAYTIAAETVASYADVYGGTADVTTRADAIATIGVTREGRAFAVALPPHEAREIKEVSVVVDNLGALSPTLGSRVRVSVTLLSADGLAVSHALRDVPDGDPLTVLLPAPDDEYTVALAVGRPTDDANGVSTNLGLDVAGQRLPGDVRVALPPLVRASGTLRDPALELASSPDLYNGATPFHFVTGTAATAGGPTVQVSAALRGFARSFTTFVPAGSTVRAGGQLTVAVGKPRPESDLFENDVVTLSVPAPADGVACDGDCTVDVVAPPLPAYVTVKGRLVGSDGKAAKTAVVSATSADPAFGGATVSAYVISDPQGRFTLRLPRAASYRLVASPY